MHKVQKNDTVLVISGNQRGLKGKVLKIFPAKNMLIVESVRLIKRHTRPSQRNPQGGIIEKEAPIHISDVMIICPSCGDATRVRRGHLKDGTPVRYCKKCESMLATKA